MQTAKNRTETELIFAVSQITVSAVAKNSNATLFE